MGERLEQILERLEAATDGPWTTYPEAAGVHPDTGEVWAFMEEGAANYRIVCRTNSHFQPGVDATFVAHAPTDLRYLLDRIEAQAEVVEAAREAIRPHGRADFEFEANERLREALDNLEEQTDD